MANTNDIARSTYDQSEILSEIGFFKTLFKLWEKGRQHCIHAIVTDGQGRDGLYEVQPLTNSMKQLKDRKEGVVRPKIRVWPLLFRHGGYRIEAYPVVGDTGYVISCDRNGNLAMAANGKENPADNEGPKDIEVFDSCKYEYGFFIPSSWVKPDPLLFDPLKQGDDPERAKFVREMREKMVIGNDKDWNDKKSAYISIDKEGNIVIHCKKLIVEGESEFNGDIHLYGKLIMKPQKDDNDEPGDDEKDDDEKEDEEDSTAELLDTKLVVGYDSSTNCLKTWKGKILRSEGDEDDPIQLQGGGPGPSPTGTYVTEITAPTSYPSTHILVKKSDGTSKRVNITDSNFPSAEKEVVTGMSYDTSSHKFKFTREKWTFVRGVVTKIESLDDVEVFEATPHSRES